MKILNDKFFPFPFLHIRTIPSFLLHSAIYFDPITTSDCISSETFRIVVKVSEGCVRNWVHYLLYVSMTYTLHGWRTLMRRLTWDDLFCSGNVKLSAHPLSHNQKSLIEHRRRLCPLWNLGRMERKHFK